MHFEKVCGAKASSNRRTGGTGTLCPREQTSESACDAVLSECESTYPLNPQTQPVFGANLCQDLFQRYHPERTLTERSVDGPEIYATPLKQGGLRLN